MKRKIEPDWDFIGELYNEEPSKQQRPTDGQGQTIIPIKKDDVKIFCNKGSKEMLRRGISSNSKREFSMRSRKKAC